MGEREGEKRKERRKERREGGKKRETFVNLQFLYLVPFTCLDISQLLVRCGK